jgi:hypothetical protein
MEELDYRHVVSGVFVGGWRLGSLQVSEWLTYCNTELSGVVTDKKLFQVSFPSPRLAGLALCLSDFILDTGEAWV